MSIPVFEGVLLFIAAAGIACAWLLVRSHTTIRNLPGRLLVTLALGSVLAVAFYYLFSAVQLAALNFGWPAVGMFVLGWLAAGSGKALIDVIDQRRRRRGFGEWAGVFFVKIVAAMVSLYIVINLAAHVFHATAAAGAPLLMGGALAAFTPIFPTHRAARLLMRVA